VFVRKLRSKLQKRSPGWEYIHTHFGIGYRFDPQPLEPGADRVPGKHEVAEEPAEVAETDPVKPAIS
jgi:DNA-binding winged helix-turn-helix (wHTH) protein